MSPPRCFTATATKDIKLADGRWFAPRKLLEVLGVILDYKGSIPVVVNEMEQAATSIWLWHRWWCCRDVP